jgi:hypothetical protein
MEVALAKIEKRVVPSFEGTEEELESLLAEGMESGELGSSEAWDFIDRKIEELRSK